MGKQIKRTPCTVRNGSEQSTEGQFVIHTHAFLELYVIILCKRLGSPDICSLTNCNLPDDG
jgi:hypothetical protein